MSENENQESTIAVNLCKNGCGFYGSTQFDGMCSVCHKEAVKKRQRQDEDQIQKPTSSPHAAAALLCASASNNYGSVPLDPDGGKDGKKSGGTGLPESVSTSTESDMRALQQQQQQQSAPATFAHPGETADSAAVAANTNEDSHGAVAGAVSLSTIPCSIAALSTNDRDSQSSSLGTDSSAASTTDSYGQQKKRIRCGMCKKKVGLTGFECRCGGVYCSAHRYSDKHSCSFDYQTHGQDQIRKANPQVVSSKIDKL